MSFQRRYFTNFKDIQPETLHRTSPHWNSRTRKGSCYHSCQRHDQANNVPWCPLCPRIRHQSYISCSPYKIKLKGDILPLVHIHRPRSSHPIHRRTSETLYEVEITIPTDVALIVHPIAPPNSIINGIGSLCTSAFLHSPRWPTSGLLMDLNLPPGS
jgi:hypothetical protein